jgi:adenylate cyclase
VASTDWLLKNGDDLRSIGDALARISHLLNEHTQRLEIAVESRYTAEMSDPRVRLLGDALHVSRVTDVELSRLNQTLQRMMRSWQEHEHEDKQAPSEKTFENERQELTTSITFLEQERNELEILYGIARTLNSTLEFDEVLRLVMERVIEFVNAERGFLMLVNPVSGELEFTIARDKNAYTVSEDEFATAKISRKTILRVIQTRMPLLTDDALLDDALKAQESIMAYGIRSIMCAPLVVRNNCIGAVYVDSRINARLFRPKHRDLLLAFCNQAAIAIDNARLFADLNKAIQQVREDKQYMDNIFGSIANGVITTDSAGIITTFNASASLILCLNPELARGRHYQEAFKSIPQVGLIAILQRAHSEHEHGTVVNQAVECQITGREQGKPVSLNFYVSSLRDTEGEHIGMALVIDDRTEIRRSEARVKEIRRLFERYVHPNVVQQLIQNPLALNLGGETKEISVVFADIRGYTSLSENMQPEDVMNLINRYLKLMCEAIWEEEGTITSFLGDAVMAIFNAPLPQKSHALHAVRAAWKMSKAVKEYQRAHPQETAVAYGIGVNTGLATVGNIGAQERMQNYTAIGDVVNVASRIQNSATENKILLNESTYIQVYRYVQTLQPFPLPVKNKAVPLIVRYLTGLA